MQSDTCIVQFGWTSGVQCATRNIRTAKDLGRSLHVPRTRVEPVQTLHASLGVEFQFCSTSLNASKQSTIAITSPESECHGKFEVCAEPSTFAIVQNLVHSSDSRQCSWRCSMTDHHRLHACRWTCSSRETLSLRQQQPVNAKCVRPNKVAGALHGIECIGVDLDVPRPFDSITILRTSLTEA